MPTRTLAAILAGRAFTNDVAAEAVPAPLKARKCSFRDESDGQRTWRLQPCGGSRMTGRYACGDLAGVRPDSPPDGDSDSSDSDTDEDDLQLWRKMILRGRSHKPLRLEGYVERIIPLLTKDQFRKHFRMIPNVFENLEALLGPVLSVTNGKAVIPVRKQLLATLWLLATPDSYRSVGERFDIAKSSLSYSFMRVIEAINDIAGQFIKWPRGQYLQETFGEKFRSTNKITSLKMNLSLATKLPVLSWCIPPYIDRGQLTNAQKKFNYEISAKRSVIERAFALLKGRFRRLKYLDMNVDEMIPYVIIACTVLHNICLKGVDDNVEDLIEERAEVID
ncbi:nuclease harbi1 [Lasius niger]|uniref:Nuclease harbi1 n=1 Tax=Lasius niger TaxID=67767 RepID=A0A0J7K726_LASNI|nr:nuclease harbi1 [Lasius niger]